MDVYKYYKKSAVVSLNNSLVALIPAVIILICGVIKIIPSSFLWIICPFLAYSVYCYHVSLVQIKRSNNRQAFFGVHKTKEGQAITSYNDVLFAFLPSPSLKMVIFEPHGRVIGEIRDLNEGIWRWATPYLTDKWFPPKYGIFDSEQRLIAQIKLTSKNIDEIQVVSEKGKPIGYAQKIISKGLSKFTGKLYVHPSKTFDVEGSFWMTDFRFKNVNGTEIARLQKGWMPIDWGERFKDHNTPILSFKPTLLDEEKLTIYGYLIFIYQYHNH